jgi:hypothetical protein
MSGYPVAEEIIQGTTRPVLPINWIKSDNSPLVLTGGTFTGTMREQQTGQVVTWAGTFAITSATEGETTYSWVAADTVQYGMWLVIVTATIAAQIYRVKFWLPITENF